MNERMSGMKKHLHTYEQYCCVLGKNIIIEEVVYHNGQKLLRCTQCTKCCEGSGCRNNTIKKAIIQTGKYEDSGRSYISP